MDGMKFSYLDCISISILNLYARVEGVSYSTVSMYA